ncbi:MAG: hypothetical protein L6R39_007620, partial [Caloplaca ligustica]
MRGTVDELQLLTNRAMCIKYKDIAGDRLIKYSIFGSNLATYDFLAPSMPSGWISEVDHRGRGPLHLLLEYPSRHVRDIVKRLLDDGADVFMKDADGNEPGDLARICDDRAKDCSCASYGNLGAYFETLKLGGFNVVLDED